MNKYPLQVVTFAEYAPKYGERNYQKASIKGDMRPENVLYFFYLI